MASVNFARIAFLNQAGVGQPVTNPIIRFSVADYSENNNVQHLFNSAKSTLTVTSSASTGNTHEFVMSGVNVTAHAIVNDVYGAQGYFDLQVTMKS